jgi:hypothetical protein
VTKLAELSPNLVECLLWAVFRQLHEQLKFLDHFFHEAIHVFMLRNYGLGYILGDFFTSPSGHPVVDPNRGQNLQLSLITAGETSMSGLKNDEREQFN